MGLDDHAVRPPQPVAVQHALAQRVHFRQNRVAVRVVRHGINEPPPVPPAPQGHLPGDILTTVLVTYVGIGPPQGRDQPRPPRMEEPNAPHASALLTDLDDPHAADDLPVLLPFVPGQHADAEASGCEPPSH